jgi:hypothetical protein
VNTRLLCALNQVVIPGFLKQDTEHPLKPYYARSICNNCEHKAECAEWGIYNERHGIWGGLTELGPSLHPQKTKHSITTGGTVLRLDRAWRNVGQLPQNHLPTVWKALES